MTTTFAPARAFLPSTRTTQLLFTGIMLPLMLSGCFINSVIQQQEAGSTIVIRNGEREVEFHWSDPTIEHYGGKFHSYASQASFTTPRGIENFRVPTSNSAFALLDVQDWSQPTEALRLAGSWARQDFRAPTIHREFSPFLVPIYFLYYSSRENANIGHSIGVASSLSPAGPFDRRNDNKLIAGDGTVAITDPEIFKDSDGSLYLLYIRDSVTVPDDDNCATIPDTLEIQGMINATTPATNGRVLLSASDAPGANLPTENCTLGNPAILKHGDRYLLLYSFGNPADQSYGTGLADCGERLMDNACVRIWVSSTLGEQRSWPKLNGWEGLNLPGGADTFVHEGKHYMAFHHGNNLASRRIAITSLKLFLPPKGRWGFDWR